MIEKILKLLVNYIDDVRTLPGKSSFEVADQDIVFISENKNLIENNIDTLQDQLISVDGDGDDGKPNFSIR